MIPICDEDGRIAYVLENHKANNFSSDSQLPPI